MLLFQSSFLFHFHKSNTRSPIELQTRMCIVCQFWVTFNNIIDKETYIVECGQTIVGNKGQILLLKIMTNYKEITILTIYYIN